MFKTDSSDISEAGVQQLDNLASYLQYAPQLGVELQGHADPRGSDAHNDLLSIKRASAVRDALVKRGVNLERIEYHGYGSRKSTAKANDLAGYAKDRKVDISIQQPMSAVVYSH